MRLPVLPRLESGDPVIDGATVVTGIGVRWIGPLPGTGE